TGVEQKIEAVQSAIRALSGANLGEIISNFLGNVNFDLAKTSFEKLIQLAEKMNELNKINISGDAITEKINELKKVIGTLTDGDGIFGKFKEIVSGSLGNETFEKANETFSLLISIAQSANRLSSISVSVSDVKDKIKDINDVVQALDSGSLSGAIGSMVKTAQINQVKSALDALVSLINPINILGNTNMFPTTASRRIEEISDMIEKLGSGKITGVIGSMIKAAQLNEVKGALDAIVQLI
ncbi:TPA: phage tail tape measure protein, partial [Enterococcus faecalis]